MEPVDHPPEIVDEVAPSAVAANNRGRGRSRSKPQNPAQPAIDSEAVIVQKVSDLAAVVSAQSAQMRATNENVNRLTEMMANLTENVRSSVERVQFVQEDREFSDTGSDSDYSVGQPRGDPFEGLFDEQPQPTHENPEEKVWDNLLASTECATEYGPELPVDLAVSLDRVAATEPNAERLKTWKQVYIAPANAKKLAPPQVNADIWDLMDSAQRAQDNQFKHCQALVSISLIAQARVLSYIREIFKQKKEIPCSDAVKHMAEPLMDSAAALGLAMRDLNIKRRSAIKKAIPALGQISWSRSIPTEFLYGDKIQDELKATKAATTFLRRSGDYARKRRPNSGFLRGNYSGNYSRQTRDKRSKPSLNTSGDSKGMRSSGPRRQPPQDYQKRN